MEESGQLLAPSVLLQGNEIPLPTYPLERWMGWTHPREHILHCRESMPGCQDRYYNDILLLLLLLLIIIIITNSMELNTTPEATRR
jgi:hypothetical protein